MKHTEYRMDSYGLIYRKQGNDVKAYSFKEKRWVSSPLAIDAFYEGEGTFEVTFEEVQKAISKP